jgi:Cu/Ag efflux pump CusA
MVVKYIKRLTRGWINFSLRFPKAIFIGMLLCVPLTMLLYSQAWKEGLPTLNEPSLTLWVVTPLGSSLEYMRLVADSAAEKILQVPWIESVAMTLWRAEADAHANWPNIAELEVHTDKSIRSQEDMIIDIQKIADEYAWVANFSVWRPITHRIQELQSWIRAPIVVKVFWPDLEVLDGLTTQILAQIQWVDGIVNAQMQQERVIPQVSLELDKSAALSLWVEVGELIEQVENGLLGIELSEIIDDNARYSLVLKFDPSRTNDLTSLSTLPLVVWEWRTITLWQVADIKTIQAPNSISHDNLQRRKVISAFVQWRDVVSAVEEIQWAVGSIRIPDWYVVLYEWDYASQKAANRQLLLVWLAVLAWIYLVLLTVLKKHHIVLQILLDVLTAFLWGMIAVALSGNVLSTAHMVWFVSLLWIVSRNWILLVEHYMYLIKEEWMEFDVDLIMKWSLERVIPVLMTVLTSGIALLPLIVWAWSQAWKEILAPIAIVTFGGLIFSSIIEIFLRPWVFYRMNKGKKLVEDATEEII